MPTKDNGSPINIVERATAIAKKEGYPDTIKVVTGNSFVYANETIAMQRINQEIRNRLTNYVVMSENDITPGKGFLTVILTKK